MTPRYYRDHAHAREHAARRRDQLQAPVAVLTRDGWYFVAETLDEYEEKIHDDGWSVVAAMHPDVKAEQERNAIDWIGDVSL